MSAADDILAFVRLFGLLERQVVCCGTVSLPQCVALQALASRPHTNTELADALGVPRGAITRLLDGMDGRGWIVRSRDAGDRRRLRFLLHAEQSPLLFFSSPSFLLPQPPTHAL